MKSASTGRWTNDSELFSLMREKLFSAVIGDVLDKLGKYHQFLPPYLRPLDPAMCLAGRAMPVLEADVFEEKGPPGNGPLRDRPFGLMFEALDDLKPDEIYIATGASHRYALWGELMSIRAGKLGAAGAVLDGYSRDTRGVLSLEFPTFSAGSYAQDQGPRGKVIDWRIPIEIGGVRIDPGTIIFGDRDGLVVIPQDLEEAVILGALEKVEGENRVAKALMDGMGALEAFKKFGIM